MPSKQHDQQQADYKKLLHQVLGSGSDHVVKKLLDELHPAEIADTLEALPRDLRPYLWQSVSVKLKGEVLLEAHKEVRTQLIENSDKEELLAALASLQMDELADLDAQLPLSVVDAMVKAMDSQHRDRYEAVRAYPDDTAGGLMDIDAAAVRADVSLKAVRRYMRRLRIRLGKLPEHLDSLMVVDRNNTYLGMLKLSDIISLESATTVREVMKTDIAAIPVMTSDNKVARLFEDQDLTSAAVVDETGRLLGRITIDDVVNVMRGEAEHEVMSRVGLTESTDMFAPIFKSATRRAVWLGINMVTAFLAAWVIGLFDGSIEKIVALAVLMPVVASMGGAAGNQTLTLVTRGLALEQIGKSNVRRLLWRELALGLLNGVFWALVVAVVAVLWFKDTHLGLIFGAALILNLLTGALAGTLVPMVLQRLGIDPALAGGVVLTTATDVVGFFSFLGLATLFLL